MTLVIASGNLGKVKEFKTLLPQFEVKTYKELLVSLEIIEDGNTFKKNAIKKAKTIYDALYLKYPNKINQFIIIADDSGISVEELNFEPNIYSARYAGAGASDKQNYQKLIQNLKEKNLTSSKAFYTACIAMVYKNNTYTTHGWMHGLVNIEPKGNNGFGYDPLFIPNGYDKTLGELDISVKKNLSHRAKAIFLMIKVLKVIL